MRIEPPDEIGAPVNLWDRVKRGKQKRKDEMTNEELNEFIAKEVMGWTLFKDLPKPPPSDPPYSQIVGWDNVWIYKNFIYPQRR